MTAAPKSEINKKLLWIVEDNKIFRKNITVFINQTEELQCAKSFGSCEQMLAELHESTPPDVILMDINLPGMSGIDGLKRLKETAPSVHVVMLTVFDENDKIFQAICAGASGYLLKSSSPEKIIQELLEILYGGAPMNPHIARKVLEMFSKIAAPKHDYDLTVREKEILRILVEGLPKRQIAEQLFLSFHTVDMHMRNIYSKLLVNTRGLAVAKAVKENLL